MEEAIAELGRRNKISPAALETLQRGAERVRDHPMEGITIISGADGSAREFTPEELLKHANVPFQTVFTQTPQDNPSLRKNCRHWSYFRMCIEQPEVMRQMCAPECAQVAKGTRPLAKETLQAFVQMGKAGHSPLKYTAEDMEELCGLVDHHERSQIEGMFVVVRPALISLAIDKHKEPVGRLMARHCKLNLRNSGVAARPIAEVEMIAEAIPSGPGERAWMLPWICVFALVLVILCDIRIMNVFNRGDDRGRAGGGPAGRRRERRR